MTKGRTDMIGRLTELKRAEYPHYRGYVHRASVDAALRHRQSIASKAGHDGRGDVHYASSRVAVSGAARGKSTGGCST